jgi:hypothetical protein
MLNFVTWTEWNSSQITPSYVPNSLSNLLPSPKHIVYFYGSISLFELLTLTRISLSTLFVWWGTTQPFPLNYHSITHSIPFNILEFSLTPDFFPHSQFSSVSSFVCTIHLCVHICSPVCKPFIDNCIVLFIFLSYHGFLQSQ